MRILVATLLASGLLFAGGGCTQGSTSGGLVAPYTVLDSQASQLRADFNRKAGSVRLLFVVDPICPTCLRGLADMNRDLLSKTDDGRLQVFVVHEPVLGIARYAPWLRTNGAQDVPEAARLLKNPHVQHYWNPSGAFGRLLSSGVGLKNGDGQVYAWDVWLLYGPEAKWTGNEPPRPELLMHQLGALRSSTQFPHLDTRAFAQRVQTLLEQLPSAGGAQPLANQAIHDHPE
jgi:hypothetical protein